MKKKIVSFFTRSQTKSFVLGIGLAFVLAFSISSVIAQGGQDTDPFIGPSSNLVNRIGSLTIGLDHNASWIQPYSYNANTGFYTFSGNQFRRDTCLTSATGNEKETCLHVAGPGVFDQLSVIGTTTNTGLPTFVTDNVFLKSGTNPNISTLIEGLESEDNLIVGNDGLNNSIMATSLDRKDNGTFTPLDTTTKRGLCANASGVLYPCDISAPLETYHWHYSGWSDCSVAGTSAGSCSGTWTSSSSNGTCSQGSYLSSCPGCPEGLLCQENLTESACNGATRVHLNKTYACNWIESTTVGSSGPFASCFIADTGVTMADGTNKNIQDVQIGDVLRGQTSNNTVLGFHQPKLGEKELYSFNGGEYFVTAEHPFMTIDGWKAFDPELAVLEHNLGIEIGQLAVGDTLITEDGNVVLETVNTKSNTPDTQLYNFILSGDRTYYADGYLVHNKTDCADGQANGGCGSNATCFGADGYTSPEHQAGTAGGECSLACGTFASPGDILPGYTNYCNNYSGLTEAYCGSDSEIHCRAPLTGSGSGTVTNSCSGPTTSSLCLSQNAACSWNAGTTGTSTKTRTVACHDSSHNVVDDSLCTETQDPLSEICEISSTGTPFTCTTSGWQIGAGTCSPLDYNPATDFDLIVAQGNTVCSSGTPSSLSCPSSGGSPDPSEVPGASVWYCHLSTNWTEEVGSTCDNQNFPSGYIWGQVRVCTTSYPPVVDNCSQGTPAPTAPSSANCTDYDNDNFWTCTD